MAVFSEYLISWVNANRIAVDLFVYPSIDEADPLSISQTMAKGKAIIATDVGDISERIVNRDANMLVLPTNPYALVIAIDFYFENKELAEKGGKAPGILLKNVFLKKR